MAITNTAVVDTTSKYIVQSKGIGDETDQILADGEKLENGTNQSKLCLIECHYQIKGTGTLKLSAESEDSDLSFTGNGKYGLRPDELKFGNDKQFKLNIIGNGDLYEFLNKSIKKNDLTSNVKIIRNVTNVKQIVFIYNIIYFIYNNL